MTTTASTKAKKPRSSPAKNPATPPLHMLKRWLTTNSSSVGKRPLHVMTEQVGVRTAVRDDVRREWLNSELVEERSTDKDWPTERSRQAWLQFYEGERKADRTTWKREAQAVRVKWNRDRAPAAGTSVIIEPSVGTYGGVMTPDLQPLGLMVRGRLRQARRNIVSAEVAADGSVEIEFFGPKESR